MARSKDNYSVIVDARRLPIGKRNGALAPYAAHQLGGVLIQSMLRDTSVLPEKVLPDEVIVGNMIHASVVPMIETMRPRPHPTQETLFYAGYGNLKGTDIGRACSSGLEAVRWADRAIRSRDCNIILAGGIESMSGHSKDFLRMVLRDPNDISSYTSIGYTTAESGDWCAAAYGISRKEQDKWATKSYMRARAAHENGFFENHVVPIGHVFRDEEPTTNTDETAIRAGKPLSGCLTVTAENASKNADSAAMLVLVHVAHAKKLGLRPLARIIAHASTQTPSGDPRQFTIEPPRAIKEAVNQSGLLMQQIGILEINAAFSSVVLYAINELDFSEDRVNVFGDAVSQGHPIGASGAIRLVELVYAMIELNIRFGAVGICHALGGATAMIIENLRMR